MGGFIAVIAILIGVALLWSAIVNAPERKDINE